MYYTEYINLHILLINNCTLQVCLIHYKLYIFVLEECENEKLTKHNFQNGAYQYGEIH